MLLNTLQVSHRWRSERLTGAAAQERNGRSARTLMPNVLLIDPTETTRTSYLICTSAQHISRGALDFMVATLCCST